MEKFTNDPTRLIEQGKKELFDYELDSNWIILLQYLEMPYFLTYAFSVQISVNPSHQQFQVRHKVWKTQYDLTRFQQGIYNLDRLAVIEKENINLSKEGIPDLPLEKVDTQESNRIALDGLICEMKIPQVKKHLKWNIDLEMNNELQVIVGWVRDRYYKE